MPFSHHFSIALSASLFALFALVISMPASIPAPLLNSNGDLQSAREVNSDEYRLELPDSDLLGAPELNSGSDSDSPRDPDKDMFGAPEPYEFGYEFGDSSGRLQHRREMADGTGQVLGRYGYKNEFGLYRVVEYIADVDGFRVIVRSNEPGLSNQNSANVKFIVEPPPEAIIEQQRLLRDKVSSNENSDNL